MEVRVAVGMFPAPEAHHAVSAVQEGGMVQRLVDDPEPVGVRTLPRPVETLGQPRSNQVSMMVVFVPPRQGSRDP